MIITYKNSLYDNNLFNTPPYKIYAKKVHVSDQKFRPDTRSFIFAYILLLCLYARMKLAI